MADQDGSRSNTTKGDTEPYLRLSALGAKNGFSPRQMAAFARGGLRVVRPFAGRVAYSRQSWLDDYLATKVPATKEVN